MGDRRRLILDGESLRIETLERAADTLPVLSLSDDAWAKVDAGRQVVERSLASGAAAYGVTTGVGAQKTSRVSVSDQAEFNRRLLLAHGTIGSERALPTSVVRAAIVVLLNGLATGRSGVRPTLLRRLLSELDAGALPAARDESSVGASDLVPLAQMAVGLLGLDGDRPFELAAKEGLSLVNSNAVSLGRGGLALAETRRLLRALDVSLCASLEGLRANLSVLATKQ